MVTESVGRGVSTGLLSQELAPFLVQEAAEVNELTKILGT